MRENPSVEHDFNNTNLVTKVKVENFSFTVNKTDILL